LENDLLTHLVLADSPGTGDPHLIEEMARDFLPICDLVLFILPATSPIVDSDLPTLRELHRRLPFIPILFVVTRADELRRDKHLPLSGDNFDKAKAAEFMAETLSRIALLLDSSQYKESDFILVDNDTQYGIATLRDELARRADPFSPSSRIAVHSHKVQFYLTSAKDVRVFFEQFLNTKITELHKIVSVAGKNIQLYNETVMITNNDLTRSWFERSSALRDICQKAADRPAALPELESRVREMSEVSEAMVREAESLERLAKTVADRIATHVRLNVVPALEDEFAKISRAIRQREKFDGLTQHSHGLGAIELRWALDEVDVVPTQVFGYRMNEVREAVGECVSTQAAAETQCISDIFAALSQRAVIEECQTIVDAAQQSLKRDLERYFQSVTVYRAGVFAIGTKGSIAKLGIGNELAQLEADFTDEDKEALILKAREELFPSVADILASVTTKMRALADRLGPLNSIASSIHLERPPKVEGGMSSAVGQTAAALKVELGDELQRETAQFIERAQTSLANVFGQVIDSYDQAIKVASKRRVWTYATTAGSLVVVAFCLTAGYAWLRHPAGQSVGAVLGWGVVANILAAALGLGVARLRDNYPETKKKISDHHLARLASMVVSVLDGLTGNHKFGCLQEPVLIARLKKVYSELTQNLADDSWQHEAEEMYELLRVNHRELSSLRSEYLGVVGELTKGFSRYFDDAKKNLQVLQRISEGVKDRAIQPSFQLLENTNSALCELRDAIAAIQFL
jgi:predicted GTPase